MTKPSSSHALTTATGQDPLPVRIDVNRRARNFILRIDPRTREAVVVVPSARAARRAPAFIAEHADWIARQLAEMPPPIPFAEGTVLPVHGIDHVIRHRPEARRGVWRGPADPATNLPALCVSGQPAHLPRRLRDWLKREARHILTERCNAHSAALNLPPPRIQVRDTTSRWGSCAYSGTLSFSGRLIFAPAPVLDYVAAHECAHRRQMNHGAGFWRLVDGLTPHRRAADRWLNAHGQDLHRYGAGPN
mgnify:CR=1 FL=1